MIKDEVTIEIKGHSYPVKFPTVGQFYQIEAMKQSLSRGFYNSMVMSPSVQAQHALDMIDIEAAVAVLCPKLIEELKVKNFSELDVRDINLSAMNTSRLLLRSSRKLLNCLKAKKVMT